MTYWLPGNGLVYVRINDKWIIHQELTEENINNWLNIKKENLDFEKEYYTLKNNFECLKDNYDKLIKEWSRYANKGKVPNPSNPFYKVYLDETKNVYIVTQNGTDGLIVGARGYKNKATYDFEYKKDLEYKIIGWKKHIEELTKELNNYEKELELIKKGKI